MPLIFKQNFNALNQEFDEYLEVLYQRSDPDFCSEVQLFAKELVAYILKIRVTQIDLPDLTDELEEGEAQGAVLIAGRLSLVAANILRESIVEKLKEDFPKFIGTKTNFWRYLVRFIPVYMDEAFPDYTREFSMATACLLELIYFSIRVGQLNLVENFKVFWIAMFLHFFGERFIGRDKCAFLKDLDIQEGKKMGKVKTQILEIIVKVEDMKECETEGEGTSKKSRKKNKKRRK